eukprot:gnl/Trimastix_PCT/1771.p1 GENE.gnl/Trimastix_PCT/1771~~gnl/Trimastix_PCT/1771.p1  ORF type:complete len:335 (+),score=85.06 gnl/Trimastix_PCT/1771:343-1347(+)
MSEKSSEAYFEGVVQLFHLFQGSEDDVNLAKAVIALYHHILPECEESFLREVLDRPEVVTLINYQSDQAIREQWRKKIQRRLQGGEEEEEEEAGDDFEREDRLGGDPDGPIGWPSRIVGAVSYEAVPNQLGLRVKQLTLIGVRTAAQGTGLGHRLLLACVDLEGQHGTEQPRQYLHGRGAATGEADDDMRRAHAPYDVLITYADNTALGFFKSHGFTDDAIATSRFTGLGGDWDESVLMCYIPPPPRLGSSTEYLELFDLDARLQSWRNQRVAEYCSELTLFQQMRAEIQHLRQKTFKQETTIGHLAEQNTLLKKRYAQLELELHRLRTARPGP